MNSNTGRDSLPDQSELAGTSAGVEAGALGSESVPVGELKDERAVDADKSTVV